jgi:hypothetical protein
MQMAGIAMASFDMDTVPGRLVIPKTVCKAARKKMAVSGAFPPCQLRREQITRQLTMTKVRGMKKIDTKVRRRTFSLCDRASRLSMTCDALKSCLGAKSITPYQLSPSCKGCHKAGQSS